MIKVIVSYQNDLINSISVTNHAGNNNVCASVSTSITITINVLYSLDLLSCVEYSLKEGNFLLKVTKSNDNTQKVLSVLVQAFDDLGIDYKKDISIKKEKTLC